jgi:hypothetical protein
MSRDLSLARERRRQCAVGFFERTALLRQPEVEQLDALLSHQDIGRLQIAMRDAFGVCGIQRIQNLAGVLDGFV